MKKTLMIMLIAALFLNLTPVSAQGKCKFIVDKTDPFTGKHVRMTSSFIENLIILSYKWEMLFQKNGEDYSVGSFLMKGGKINDNIEKGDSLMIKFADGKLLTLHTNNKITPRFTEISNSKFLTSYESYYPITIGDLKTFASSMITVVRINTGSKIYQQEVKEKNATKILQAASCILQ